MNEQQRQIWIRTLGFTPWVASQSLPGAAPSPVLEVTTTAQISPEESPTREVGKALNKTLKTQKEPARYDRSKTVEQPAETDRSGSAAVPALRFTLYAYDMGSLWLIVQQQQADNPEFSREEKAKLQQLMRVWGEPQGKRRSLILSEKTLRPLNSQNVRETVYNFMSVLKRKHDRFLFSASESFNRVLHDQPRFQLTRDQECQWLVISALYELIAQPQEHRVQSWEAMRKAKFNA